MLGDLDGDVGRALKILLRAVLPELIERGGVRVHGLAQESDRSRASSRIASARSRKGA